MQYLPNIFFALALAIGIGFFVMNIRKLSRNIKLGKYVNRTDKKSERFKNMIKRGDDPVDIQERLKAETIIEDFEASVYREIILPPCRIFYRIANNIVYIIHVIREEQLLHVDILKSR